MEHTHEEGFTTADLFAGIGGFRLGFEKAGFRTLYTNDNNIYCKKTYETNFGSIMDNRNIEDVPSEEIPDVDIILAGFPCQPFSMIGKRQGFNDHRGHAFFELQRIIRDKQPKAIILENVRHITSHDSGRTMEVIKDVLENQLGYHMHYKILNSMDYGLPQNRNRTYMVGFKDPVDFSWPEPVAEKRTIKDILETEQVDEDYFLSQKYLEGLEKHKERHAERGHGFGFQILNPDGVAFTLVVGNMGRERNLVQDVPRTGFYEPGLDRAVARNAKAVRKLTIKECARLQGFPDDFTFPVSRTQAYKQLGNAVSVNVSNAVAKQVKDALLSFSPLPATSPEPAILNLESCEAINA